MTSEKLYIDKVIAGGREISTGNNGGYLNLVNKNYTPGPYPSRSLSFSNSFRMSFSIKDIRDRN
ncbi:MAG: hypothetical protein V4722_20350 [Bacteroidota bacterium]